VLSTASVAVSQQASAPGAAAGYREVTDEQLIVQPFNLTVDQIDDMGVFGPDGEKIGKIEEVLTDAAGKPLAASVEVDGFLRIGERKVVVILDQLRLVGQRWLPA
jgi:hypothetical protein